MSAVLSLPTPPTSIGTLREQILEASSVAKRIEIAQRFCKERMQGLEILLQQEESPSGKAHIERILERMQAALNALDQPLSHVDIALAGSNIRIPLRDGAIRYNDTLVIDDVNPQE